MAAKAKTQNPAVKVAGVQPVEIEKIKSVLFERRETGDIASLAKSMATKSQLEPVMLRKLPDGNFQLVFGYRRYLAAKQAGIKTIEAKIIECDDELALYELLWAENMERKEFTDYEIALLIKSMMDRGLKAVEVAKRFNRSSSWISTKLKVLEAPKEVQEAVKAGKITAEHARQISKISDEKERQKAIEKATKAKLTVKEAKEAAEKEKERQRIMDLIEEKKKELEQAKTKLAEYPEAEKELEQVQKRLEEIEKEIQQIDNKARELKVQVNGVEIDVETVIQQLNDVDVTLRQKESMLEREKAVKQKLMQELEETKTVTVEFKEFKEVNGKLVEQKVTKTFQATEPTKQEYKSIYEKTVKEIAELEKRLKLLRAQRDNAEAIVKAIEKAEKKRKDLKKDIENQSGKINNLEKEIHNLRKRLSTALINYDKFKQLAKEHKELLEKREKLLIEAGELKTKQNKLNSKINNRSKTESRIEKLQKEISELEAQLKQL